MDYNFLNKSMGYIKLNNENMIVPLSYIYSTEEDLLKDGFEFYRLIADVKKCGKFTVYRLYRFKVCNCCYFYALLDESISERRIPVNGEKWWYDFDYVNNRIGTVYSTLQIIQKLKREQGADKTLSFHDMCSLHGIFPIRVSDTFLFRHDKIYSDKVPLYVLMKIKSIDGEMITFIVYGRNDITCSVYMLQTMCLKKCSMALFEI